MRNSIQIGTTYLIVLFDWIPAFAGMTARVCLKSSHPDGSRDPVFVMILDPDFRRDDSVEKDMFIIAIIAGISAYLITHWIAGILHTQKVRARLGLGNSAKIPNGLIINLTRPIWSEIAPYLVKLKLQKIRDALNKIFVSANMDGFIKVEDFWALQATLSFIFSLLGCGFGFMGLFFGFVLGFAFPIMWLRGLSKRRKEAINLAMPEILDLLTLSVEAGLDFMASIGRIVNSNLKDPFSQELKRLLDEIRIGLSRAEGLRHLAERCNVPAVSSFTALLIQADRLGASVGPVLRAQSEKLRNDRFERAERAGAAASQKILFPLIFCIIPAVFIVIFGPIIVTFLSGGFKL